jgi:hypothetical protein
MIKENTIEHVFMYLVVEVISIPILMLCLSSLWQFHTGDLWYLTLIWFVLLYSVNAIMKHIVGTYAVNIYGWIMCKFTVPQRTIESKTNMQYIFKIILINTEKLSDKITWNNKYNWTRIYVFSGRSNQYSNTNAVFILPVTIPHWKGSYAVVSFYWLSILDSHFL